MQRLQKIFIGALIVLSCFNSLNARPMHDEAAPAIHLKETGRTQRQVVQPTWLMDKKRPLTPSEAKVRITAKNLQETAELREEIQKAVNEGRYAVEVDEESIKFVEEANFRSQSMAQPLGPLPPNQPQRPFPWIPMDQFHSQQQKPNIMQRMWNDFMQNTRRM